MSIASSLARKDEILILETNKEKIERINSRKPSFDDPGMTAFCNQHDLTIKAIEKKEEAYQTADFIIICVPTDFNNETSSFDTDILEGIISDAIRNNNNALIIIKSTVPVGYTSQAREKYQTKNIIFSPEFLREHSAMYDVLNPSRVIVGNDSELSTDFAELIAESTENEPEIILMPSSDAEAVKLFSNTYLAMRVAFFNELDTFSIAKDISTENVINGVSTDPRIGKQYNNPSFGYGGYCLPKDTKQLLSSFDIIPQSIISAIIESNSKRKEFLVQNIINLNPSNIGVYRLVMKKGSENFKESSILEVIDGKNVPVAYK